MVEKFLTSKFLFSVRKILKAKKFHEMPQGATALQRNITVLVLIKEKTLYNTMSPCFAFREKLSELTDSIQSCIIYSIYECYTFPYTTHFTLWFYSVFKWLCQTLHTLHEMFFINACYGCLIFHMVECKILPKISLFVTFWGFFFTF